MLAVANMQILWAFIPARERNLKLEVIVHKQVRLVKALQLAWACLAIPCLVKLVAVYEMLKLRFDGQVKIEREISHWKEKEEILRAS